jgi:hypothetical protein
MIHRTLCAVLGVLALAILPGCNVRKDFTRSEAPVDIIKLVDAPLICKETGKGVTVTADTEGYLHLNGIGCDAARFNYVADDMIPGRSYQLTERFDTWRHPAQAVSLRYSGLLLLGGSGFSLRLSEEEFSATTNFTWTVVNRLPPMSVSAAAK